jgi:hypothetical protein
VKGQGSLKSQERWIFYGLITGLLLLHAFLHYLTGFNFPVPWNDDATFLWPCVSFSQTGSIFTPVMNAHRMILIMPPGYPVITGLILKLTGFTFTIGRAISLFYLLLFFIIFLNLLRKNGFGNGYLFLACLFLLHPKFVAAGNLGRMDTIMLLAIISGYWLFSNRWYFAGLFLVWGSLLFHPNGIYYLAGLGIYALLQKDSRDSLLSLKPQRKEWFIIAAVVLGWLGYFYLIATHWDIFKIDMAMQFRRKLGYSQLPAFFKVENYLAVIICLFWILYFGIKKKENMFLMAIAVPGFLASMAGKEIWYEVHLVLFYLILTLLLLRSGLTWLSQHREKLKNIQLIYPQLLLLVLLVFWNVRVESLVISWPRYVKYGWLGMQMFPSNPYVTPQEIKQVKTFIYQYHQAHPEATFSFLFSGESLLFADMEKEGIKFRQFFESPVNSDIVIDHESSLRPPWLRENVLQDLARFNSALKPEKGLIYQRDSTSVWYMREPQDIK